MILSIDSAETQDRKTNLMAIAKRNGMESVIGEFATDVSIGSVFGMELKRPSDFIASIQDQRLFQQAKVLATDYERSCILVEGTITDVMGARRGMTPASVLGAIYSVAVRQGVPVIFTHPTAKGYYGMHLDAAIRAGIKEGAPSGSLMRRKSTEKDCALAILSSFPGIGPRTASAILNHFGSVGNALASMSDWTEVKGVGSKTIENCEALMAKPIDPPQELLP